MDWPWTGYIAYEIFARNGMEYPASVGCGNRNGQRRRLWQWQWQNWKPIKSSQLECAKSQIIAALRLARHNPRPSLPPRLSHREVVVGFKLYSDILNLFLVESEDKGG